MNSKLTTRLLWRLGRYAYCQSRGEPSSASISENGEADIQAKVLAAIPSNVKLQALDIGANEGEWTRSLIQQASEGRCTPAKLRIDAFEPISGTADRFEKLFSENSLNRMVRLHRLAISDVVGEQLMALMSESGGTNTLHHDTAGLDPIGGWQPVSLDTLDSFCAANGVTHVHLAKCDTEGHDAKVLKGAAGLLLAGKIDVFQFEYNHRWVHSRAFLKDVFDLVRGLPYRVAKVRRRGEIDIYPSWHPELDRFFEANYLLVHERALPWFKCSWGSFDVSNTFA